jgi:hypothetical protein
MRAFGPIWMTVAVLSCGGKQWGTDTLDPDGAAPAAPAPTCDAICTHLVGSCVPGGSTTACVADCESARQSHACPRELDDYLRCASTSAVECSGNRVVIISCSDERQRVDACGAR